ncbi:MAG: OmpA family protein [Bacteroidales bacterium]
MKYYRIKILVILSLTACIFDVSAQKKEGDIERNAGNYQKAISYYLKENLSTDIAFNLAMCYAMIGQNNAAFNYLNFLVEQEKENLIFSALEDIKEFEKIKTFAEWEKLKKKSIQYQNAFEAKLNIPLRDSILEMRRIDNYYQEKFDSIMLTNDSVLIQSFKDDWGVAVNENDLKLSKIIDTYGWPTRELAGDIASGEFFFIVQHSSDHNLQKKCLIKFKQTAGNDINKLSQIAYLEDRVLAKSGEKQLYGTQYKKGELYPVEDPDNLNKRRAQTGLAPVQIIPTNSSPPNLIPNYGFELFPGDSCPKFLVQINGGWEKLGGESFTYLDNDPKSSQGRNFIHLCKDQAYFNSCSGNAYVRYFIKDFNNGFNQELFQVEMKDSLIKGGEYLIEYYIRIEAKNQSALTNKNDVCIFLLKNKYHYKTTGYFSDGKPSIKENFKIKPDIFFYDNKSSEDFSEWTKISEKYVAKGGEKYFLIGCYGSIKNDCTINIDNITLQKIFNNKINIENTKIGDAIILENISFELNSSKLTESSYPTLNNLVECFNTYPNLKVEITGHTDNTGNKVDNIKLSENRAKSVVGYLISEGVKPNRVQAKGYGESFPISDNTTEKGREKNRRVEFKIIQR